MYFDLVKELRAKPALGAKLVDQIRDIKRFDGDPERRHKLREAVFRLLETTHYNAAPLVPFYFRRSESGSPLQLMNRPYAVPLMDMRMNSETTLLTGRQVGKSSTLVIRNKVVSDIVPNFGTLYIAPHPVQLRTFVNRYKKMEAWYQYPVLNRKFRQNLSMKEAPNGSVTEMVHALDDAGPLRGKSADEIDIDEYQSFNPDHVYELKQILRASPWKLQMRTGTALTVDNPLNLKFEEGSQGRWIIPCELGHYNNLGEAKTILRTIRPDGMYCAQCRSKGRRTRINPLHGFYDHAYPSRADNNHVSIHAPQLIVPAFVMDPVEWLIIYNDFVEYPTDKFLQEVCGIATASAKREITKEDLMAICDPEMPDWAERRERARNGYYKWVVSGCDWGGSDDDPIEKIRESFTVHCIMGVTPYGRIDLLHFKQYPGMGYERIADSIMETHRDFRAHALASDAGVGDPYNLLLRKQIPSARHFVMDYVGPKSAALALPGGPALFNKWSLNKTDSITTLYLAIKSARIRCFPWAEAEPYLMQFLTNARVPIDKENGTGFKYIRHGSLPDDAMHACNFAYVMLRVLMNEDIVVDPSLRREIARRVETGTGDGAVGLAIPGAPDYFSF